MPEDPNKARQRKAAYDEKRRRILLTLTPAQDREIRRAAREAGLKPAVFVRQATLAYMEQRYLVPKDQAESLTTLIAVLRNIGNSLNQVARFAATLQKKRTWFGQKPFDWKEAEAKVRELEGRVEDFIRRPPRESGQP